MIPTSIGRQQEEPPGDEQAEARQGKAPVARVGSNRFPAAPGNRSSAPYLLTVQKSTPHTLLNVTPCTLERNA